VEEELQDPLERMAATARIVFFAGLPGTGKSFFARQLTEHADAAGRIVHLLEWDVVRPIFEATPSGRRYPMRDGVTQPMIRKAAGIWVRQAILNWNELNPTRPNLLIGETPLVGNRFVELVRVHNDRAEDLLTDEATIFAVPIPSAAVRLHLEEERARRSAAEQDDAGGAVPGVMVALWDELVEVSRKLGIPGTRATGSIPYDPVLYERVYRRILSRRRRHVFHVEELSLPGPPRAKIPTREFVPTPDEADLIIRETEARYPRREAVAREMENWYVV
jgi:hypothetical protein